MAYQRRTGHLAFASCMDSEAQREGQQTSWLDEQAWPHQEQKVCRPSGISWIHLALHSACEQELAHHRDAHRRWTRGWCHEAWGAAEDCYPPWLVLIYDGIEGVERGGDNFVISVC